MKIKNRNFGYYILFFILFGLFFVVGVTENPQDLSESGQFESSIRVINYSNQNNITLEKSYQLLTATSGLGNILSGKSRLSNDLFYLYAAPLYCLIRALTMKLPFHTMASLNILNLIIACLFFYGSYLLIRQLFGNDRAIKTLLIMLSFYGTYTVTRFSARGYLVLVYAFILMGCYYIWRAALEEKSRFLIPAGIFMGLAWTSGTYALKFVPAFLLITLAFYLFHLIRKENYNLSLTILKKAFYDLLLVITIFTVTSAVISMVVVYYFKLDSVTLINHFPEIGANNTYNDSFLDILFLKAFAWRADVKSPSGIIYGWKILRRLRIFIFFPDINDIDYSHIDEHLTDKALIPEIFILFIFYFFIRIWRSSEKKSFVVYASSLALSSLYILFFLPGRWEIRYNLIFFPFIALVILLGMEYFFNGVIRRIQNNTYRNIAIGLIIAIVASAYFARVYDIYWGEYAHAGNHSRVSWVASRSIADTLLERYPEYNRTITLLPHYISSIQIMRYYDLNPNYRYAQFINYLKGEVSEFIPLEFQYDASIYGLWRQEVFPGELHSKLLDNNIITSYGLAHIKIYYFNSDITDEEQLRHNLFRIGIEKPGQVIDHWRKSQRPSSLQELYQEYSSGRGNVFILADKRYLKRLLATYPHIKLEREKEIEFPETTYFPIERPVILYSLRGV